jgi:hypothetical protein
MANRKYLKHLRKKIGGVEELSFPFCKILIFFEGSQACPFVLLLRVIVG